MGHIDLAAPVSHIWFFKGVAEPHRLPAGHGAEGAREVLTSPRRSSRGSRTRRARATSRSSKGGSEGPRPYTAEREERVLELRESLGAPRGLSGDRQADRLGDDTCGRLARHQGREAARGSDKHVKEVRRPSRPTSPTPRPTSRTRPSPALVWRSSVDGAQADRARRDALRELKRRFLGPLCLATIPRRDGRESIRDLPAGRPRGRAHRLPTSPQR